MPVTVRKDHVSAFVENITALTKRKVMIGIPAEMAKRDAADGQEINNAQIGYLNEFGQPERGLPARPHLIPAVQAYSHSERCLTRLRNASNALIHNAIYDRQTPPKPISQPRDTLAQMKDAGNKLPDAMIGTEVMKQLNAMGLEAVAAVKGKITDGLTPPLAPATLAARKRKGFAGEKPLIQTSDYLRHINYVIRKS